MGPLLFRTTNSGRHESDNLASLLKGSDLTARVITANLLDAMAQIIEACEGRLQFLTLLKGISLCESCYPEPHLRPMRDLDFLVAESDLAVAESQLEKLGYVPRSNHPVEFFKSSHQRIPLYHPERGIWVEIHHKLFAPRHALSSQPVFSAKNVASQRRDSRFQGRHVSRLAPELQAVYIASHWAKEWNAVGGLVPLVDLIFLLNAAENFDWDLVLNWVDGTVSAAHLYLALSYLQRYTLVKVAAGVLTELFRMQACFGRVNLRILHALIDHFLANGFAFENERVSWRLASNWRILLIPGSPFRNLLNAFWTMLPSTANTGTQRARVVMAL
jgi:hypothetical protein